MHGFPHIVRDVMTCDVAVVDRDAPFKTIVLTLRDRKVSALPVVDGAGRVLGIVSEADLLPKEGFRDGAPDGDTQVRRLSGLAKAGAVTSGELMTRPALTVTADSTLAQAARIMARGRVKRLPVVDGDGRLEGVVSRVDLLKVFLRDDDAIAEEVRREVVAYLFPMPGSAVQVQVRDGVVRLRGRIKDASLVPAAAQLVRAVEGVVDVDADLIVRAAQDAPTA
ncbi:CBS domain-containing protein [Streptomyces nigra]|uniref:CBS domain-containing protein n=1 Tax=Streptomyces nigra TaxID=1827580 RepID=UPI0036CD782D